MLKPSQILGDFVELLRDIPELITEMGGDPYSIYAFDSTYPVGVNLEKALQEMRSPSLMIRYRSPGQPSLGGKWSHSLTMYVRPKPGSSHETFLDVLMNGIPMGQPLALENICINDDLDPMRFTFSEPIPDAEGVEYLEIQIDTDER